MSKFYRNFRNGLIRLLYALAKRAEWPPDAPAPGMVEAAQAQGTHYFVLKFIWSEDENFWLVEISPFANCVTQGESLPDAALMAGERLSIELEQLTAEGNILKRRRL